jgi:hypothetical protein
MRVTLKALVFVLVFVALSALAAPAARAAGAEVNWKYVEAGYLNVNVDDLDESGDNYFVGAAFNLGKHFHIIGQYTNGELAPDFDFTQTRLGFGWHGLLGDRADVVGEAYWLQEKNDAPGASSETDDGYRLTAGVRFVPIKLFEMDGFVHYNDIADESDTSWEARGILNIWRLGFGASYEKFDESDQWNGFVRFNFGLR